jgi:hypothetical protein
MEAEFKKAFKELESKLDETSALAEKAARMSDVAAKGVGFAVSEAQKANIAFAEYVAMEKEEEKPEEKEEKRVLSYHKDGRLKSIKCGDKSKTVVWAGDLAVGLS